MRRPMRFLGVAAVFAVLSLASGCGDDGDNGGDGTSGTGTTSSASGSGTYMVLPGVTSEFQFNQSLVQCKIERAVQPDGTILEMHMFSESVDSVSIDSQAKTVTITGSMVSIVTLRYPNGTTDNLTETVPYTAVAQDKGSPGAGVDTFALTVVYVDTPGLDQFDLFGGSPATFSGTLATGEITIT